MTRLFFFKCRVIYKTQMDEISQLGTLILEGSLSLMVFVLAYKLHRMKIETHSGCCGGKFILDTANEGAPRLHTQACNPSTESPPPNALSPKLLYHTQSGNIFLSKRAPIGEFSRLYRSKLERDVLEGIWHRFRL